MGTTSGESWASWLVTPVVASIKVTERVNTTRCWEGAQRESLAGATGGPGGEAGPVVTGSISRLRQ